MVPAFTPAQAAAVTGLPLSAIHKAIDSRLIRPRRAKSGSTIRRLLSKDHLVFLQLEAEGLRLLPLRVRREIAAEIQRSPTAATLPIAGGDALRLDLRPARRKVDSRIRQIARLERLATRDPEVMAGTPVFRGTRIPVHSIGEMLKGGATAEEIVAGYPALNHETVALAPAYAAAFPKRGRPIRPWSGAKPRRLTSFHLVDLR